MSLCLHIIFTKDTEMNKEYNYLLPITVFKIPSMYQYVPTNKYVHNYFITNTFIRPPSTYLTGHCSIFSTIATSLNPNSYLTVFFYTFLLLIQVNTKYRYNENNRM